MRKSRGMLMAMAMSLGMSVRSGMVSASETLPTFINYDNDKRRPSKPNKVSQSKRRKYVRQGR